MPDSADYVALRRAHIQDVATRLRELADELERETAAEKGWSVALDPDGTPRRAVNQMRVAANTIEALEAQGHAG